MDRLVPLDPKERLALLVHKVLQALKEPMDPRVLLVHKAPKESPALEFKVPLAPLVRLESLELPVRLESLAQSDLSLIRSSRALSHGSKAQAPLEPSVLKSRISSGSKQPLTAHPTTR